ncbi:MAG: hypothetical protein Q9163_003000 [Psora crenata]
MEDSTSSNLIKGAFNSRAGLDLLRGPSATVVVGREQPCTWNIPKALLVHHSPFFAKALNGPFTEATTLSVTLPEDEPATFELFLNWLYIGKFSYLGKYPKVEAGDLVKVWALCDKLECFPLQDRVMVALIKKHSDEFLGPSTVAAAYSHSAPGSSLRKFIVAQYMADFASIQGVIGWDRDWNVAASIGDFTSDLIKAQTSRPCERPQNPLDYQDDYLEGEMDQGWANNDD